MWDKTNETDLGRRVAALESQTVALRRRVAELASRVPVLSEVRYESADDHRDAERPVEPEPELVYSYDSEPAPEQMWACELAETCLQAQCQLRVPHPLRDNCKQPCCSQPHDGGRCIPVPASPEVAIPDVPTPVGTDGFRLRLAGHMQELAGSYRWGADHLGASDILIVRLARLAGVACTLRDAYELARTGEHVAAQEKLEEISW